LMRSQIQVFIVMQVWIRSRIQLREAPNVFRFRSETREIEAKIVLLRSKKRYFTCFATKKQKS
jgi:hypothetical protein